MTSPVTGATSSIEITPEAVRSAEDHFPPNMPLLMLNLLRYREVANYGPGSTAPRRSGRQAYFEAYLPAFSQVVADKGLEGVEVVFAGQVEALVVAPRSEHWDVVAIARYPSFAVFREITESREYARHAAPHRTAALADLRLIATVALDAPR